MKINSRQLQVLRYILDNKTQASNEIADKLDIHPRTLYRDLNKITSWIEENQVLPKGRISAGFETLWEGDARKKVEDLIEQDLGTTKYDPEKRRFIILSELLLSSEPVKIFYLADKLNVTENTVISDLDKVEVFLKDYCLELVRKPGLGLYVKGDEKRIRNAIMNIFYQGLDLKDVRELIKKKITETSSEKAHVNIADRLLGLVEEETIIRVEEVIRSMEKELGEKLTDDAYIGLLIHTILAISRLKSGDTIKVSEEVLSNLRPTPEFEVAQKAGAKLGKEFGIKIPIDEVAYITMHLRGAKVSIERLPTEKGTYLKYDVTGIVNRMLKKAAELTGIEFNNDKDLYMGLLIHLKPAITRLELNMPIRNPLLEAIKKQYKDLFDLSQTILKVLEDEIGCEIPEEETGFVAMHLGAYLERKKSAKKERVHILVVCPSGLGTSRLLSSKLIKEVGEIEVVGHTAIEETEDFLAEHPGVDLVVSTINLGERSFDYIVVNPLLTGEDVMALKKRIGIVGIDDYNVDIKSQDQVNSYGKKQTFDMVKLKRYIEASEKLNRDFFLKEKITINNRDELLKYIARYVSGQDRARVEKLFEDIKRREDLMGTAIKSKNLALVHAKSESVDEVIAGVFRTKSPVAFTDAEGNKELVDTVLMLLMGCDTPREHKEMLSQLSAMIVEAEDFIPMLRIGDEEEIKEVVMISFNQFIQNYIKNCKV
ncbi:BglG family transcription antiterminator [Alkalibacter saccharofermentans]|uniref:Transcriptional antiterminator, BglG family n=1 Tax=Alkalibacter saccharofermentans DSM 14828 TaxID=1120975 RepID=A0A1M4YKT4_9FIRM|nr:BglG family transcription antiterminator [Alkalibacter saccharofermentans]SHF06360.1 transcriptional antiterminator, BglG family [Alkalibacter saccharofermentans DSM 14828]